MFVENKLLGVLVLFLRAEVSPDTGGELWGSVHNRQNQNPKNLKDSSNAITLSSLQILLNPVTIAYNIAFPALLYDS
jgi:hypothetical protein